MPDHDDTQQLEQRWLEHADDPPRVLPPDPVVTAPPPAQLVAALARAQLVMETPRKTKTATVRHSGGTYSYAYASLDDVLRVAIPALGEHDLALTQDAEVVDVVRPPNGDTAQLVRCVTTLWHGSGERLPFGPLEVPVEGSTAQAIGAAISYARRYQLCTALGIAAETDSDGNAEVNAAPPAGADGPTAGDESIMRQLHAIATSKGVTHDELHGYAVATYGVESMSQLQRAQLLEMIRKLRAMPDVDATATVGAGGTAPVRIEGESSRPTSEGASRTGSGSDEPGDGARAAGTATATKPRARRATKPKGGDA